MFFCNFSASAFFGALLLFAGMSTAQSPHPNELLHNAVVSGNQMQVAGLLADGGDVNYANQQGTTLLMRAIVSSHNDIVSLLLHRGADLVRADSMGKDALEWALVANNLKAATMLISRGARIDDLNKNGYDHLSSAVLRSDKIAVEYLLLQGADPTQRGPEGLTALELAASKQQPDIVKLLSQPRPRPATSSPPSLPNRPRSTLSAADSALLHAVYLYDEREAFFDAIQRGRTRFDECRLVALDLSMLNLANLDLSNADLQGCDLRNANLQGTLLRGANLTGCYLKDVLMQGADVSGADLTDAYLIKSQLHNVKGLTHAQLLSTKSLFGSTFDAALERYVSEELPGKLSDTGSDWESNPWFKSYQPEE
jgi:ankyrin repeat protein